MPLVAQLYALARAVRAGAAEVSPDYEFDVRKSSAVSGAAYNVIRSALDIQFRGKRRKVYRYPMNIERAAAFGLADSKGTWLKGRASSVVGRDPLTGRFDGGVAIGRLR